MLPTDTILTAVSLTAVSLTAVSLTAVQLKVLPLRRLLRDLLRVMPKPATLPWTDPAGTTRGERG